MKQNHLILSTYNLLQSIGVGVQKQNSEKIM